MERWKRSIGVGVLLMGLAGALLEGRPKRVLELKDVFELEWASDPQISPDGKRIAYVRNFMDVTNDRRRSNLWLIDVNGKHHRPLTTGSRNDSSPRWSPSGDRLLYVSNAEGSSQLYVRWMDTGQTARLTQLRHSPSGLTWSPSGDWIAFTMLVAESPSPFVELPNKPRGAEWAPEAKMITRLQYRADGTGFLEEGHDQLFIISSEGGTPLQLTSGAYDHGSSVSWSADGHSLIFSGNRRPEWQYDPLNSEVYEVSIDGGEPKPLTSRQGPDGSPQVSPDGRHIAYLGFDDRYQGYQLSRLYVMDRAGDGKRLLLEKFDRSINDIQWSGDSSSLYFHYDDEGDGKLGRVTLDGEVTKFLDSLGGTSLGRPYSGGSFSAAPDGTLAFTHSGPHHLAEVAVLIPGKQPRRLTHLNRDLFSQVRLGEVEEIWYKSSFDGRRVQGWVVKPPHFQPGQKYPLILEIHGGPFANYGPRFAAEIQLYAAAGYVVLYANPRGSTSYGEEFGNLIHHNYPGQDYDDLMSGVDTVVAQGYVDPEKLYVTGGSGGGVLTSWIVGKTDRFRAAVVAKPVINWYSFVLTADYYSFFYKYWFPGFPWEHPDHYLKRSPLSLVGNVKTPTMVLTGEEDYRTPMSESEQYYQALKLRRIDAALVRIPGASHGIASRPSHLMTKVAHILKWFETH